LKWIGFGCFYVGCVVIGISIGTVLRHHANATDQILRYMQFLTGLVFIGAGIYAIEKTK
jgi:threonine/homoserine/homoserine lactone efflux protein